MLASSRRLRTRLWLGGAVLLFGLACGESSCDCVAPLQGPVAEDAKLYDAVQARLTPAAFDFVEDNLTDIIETFLEGGLTFDVPRVDEEFCAPPFDWPCLNFRICENTCQLTADIVEAGTSRVAPDILALDALVNLDGTITLRGSMDCDIPIHVQNKPVHADVRFIIDGRDHLLTFNVEGVDLSLSNDDYTLDCDWWIDWLMELLKGTITNLINDQIGSQLDSALGDAMAEFTCLPCDFYSGGCPAGSDCNGDGFCERDGQCLVSPLGVVGRLDLGELLADVSPGLAAELDLFVAAGQWESAAVDPLVLGDGLEARLIGGAGAERHSCVPQPDPAEVPSNAPPPRLPFSDVVPGTADGYMTGIGVSDAFLDWFMYKAFLSGLLCLTIDTATTDGMLSSGTLAALLGSLNRLTGGRNTPVRLQLVPGGVPQAEIGAGTFTTDADGNRVMDEPLLHLLLPRVGLDFYVLIDERWVRVVTLTQDIRLMLGLDFTPDNTVVPLFDEDSIEIENVQATNYELLAEDPAALEGLIPTLVGMALPMLTDSLAPIEIPPIEGFALEVTAVQGDLPRPNSGFFEYMGIYANLRLAAAPLPPPRHTRAELLAVRTPVRSLMSLWAPGGAQYPEVEARVATASGAPAEYSWSLDGGPWSVYQTGPQLIVHDPRLALTGEHELAVRARTPGDYLTLDPDPARIRFTIAPEDDGVRYVPPPGPAARARLAELGLAPQTQPLQSGAEATAEAENPARVGCASAPAGAASPLWLLLGLFWALHRRRR